MNAHAVQLQNALTAALARYEQWEQPLRKYRGQSTGRLNRGGYTWDAFDRGLRELEASLCAAGDPRAELHPLFEQLCDAYAAGSDASQGQVRAFAAKQQKLGGLLWRYANHLAGQTSLADDRDARILSVTRALAAVSIENCASDLRDTLMTLADLYIAAEAAGLEPAPLYAVAATWSTDEFTAGGCESLARTLAEFHACSVLRERRTLKTPYGGPH